MAHKTRINGTNYSITGGKTKVGGTNYSVKGGKTLVGGTVRTISFGPELVSFSIFDGYMVPMCSYYMAEASMTFEDWINSDYFYSTTDEWGSILNEWGLTPENFSISNNKVYLNGVQLTVWDDNAMGFIDVYATDVFSDFCVGAAGIEFNADGAIDGGGDSGDSGGDSGGGSGTNQFTVLSSDNDIYTWDVEDTFNCDPGMTWGEWIESDYNTYGWVIDSVGFVRPSMYSDYGIFAPFGAAGFTFVGSGDKIIIGGTYYLENEIYM